MTVCHFELDERAAVFLRDKVERVAKAVVAEATQDMIPMRPTLVSAICSANGFPSVALAAATLGRGSDHVAQRAEYGCEIAERGEILIAAALAFQDFDPVLQVNVFKVASMRLPNDARRWILDAKSGKWSTYDIGYDGSQIRDYVAGFLLARARMTDGGQDADKNV